MNTRKQRTKTRARSAALGKGRRGVATIEMAVALPILTLLFLGAVDVGQYANVGQAVCNSSREGARLAARYDTLNVSEVQSAVLGYLADSIPNVPSDTLAAAVQVKVRDANGNDVLSGDMAKITTGERLSVEVVLQFDTVRWLSLTNWMQGRTLSTRTVMRRE